MSPGKNIELDFRPRARALGSSGARLHQDVPPKGLVTPYVALLSQKLAEAHSLFPLPSDNCGQGRTDKKEAQLWHSPGIDRCAGVEEFLGHQSSIP